MTCNCHAYPACEPLNLEQSAFRRLTCPEYRLRRRVCPFSPGILAPRGEVPKFLPIFWQIPNFPLTIK
jgi:hypothetical protein